MSAQPLVQPLKVAVIGAGTAGLASSIFLSRLGHAVTVFEKAERLEAVGAGVLLQPKGQAVLQALGVGESIQRLGSRIDSLVGYAHTGETVLDLHYSDLKPDYHGLGVHRHTLMTLLHDQLEREGQRKGGNVEIRTGCGVESISQTSDSVTLHGMDGRDKGPYDAVIVASGGHSASQADGLGGLHQSCGIRHRYLTYPWGALWTIVKVGDIQLYPGILQQFYRSTEVMFGLLPSGRLPDEPDQELLSLFWSVHHHRVGEWGLVGLQPWLKEMSDLCPKIEALLHEQVHDARQVAFAEYGDVSCDRYHSGRVVFIGDSAHAMSPQLGAGTNLALIDSALLTHAMHHRIIQGGGGSVDVVDAFKEYNSLRSGAISYYHLLSLLTTPLFQSSIPLVGPARDKFYGALGQIVPVRNLMLKTLACIKDGVIREQSPEELLELVKPYSSKS